MKFVIYLHDDYDECPHTKAHLEMYTRVDERTVDDPSKLHYGAKSWYTEGCNHRVENGHIMRDFSDGSAWFIDIDTLDELTQLVRDVEDDVVIGPFFMNSSLMALQIGQSE